MVISNDMDAAEQSGIIHVDEADHFSESWIPPFEHRDEVKVRKSEKFSDFYDLYECIGEGKFGQVYRCVEKATQLTLAAKTIRIKRDADRAQIENEVAIMTQMKHKCIAQIYDAFQTATNDVILIMEIVEGGELFDRVADDGFILTELAVAMILHQLCEAIAYIHSQNIIHLDLKPENIMCVSLESNEIKLIDFGLAQHYDGQSDLLFMAGTPEFAAPEVIKFEPLDFHTDMWSVGVITYILLSGQSPFLGSNVALTYNNVERGEWSFCEEFGENGISEAARDFISKLLIVDKSKRMLPCECLKHPWIVECRKRAARNSEEKRLDTGKLRSYVRNKHFRRLVFGVLFINTVLRMINTMQEKKSANGIAYEKKSANGIAYVKTMYNLAGKKKRGEAEPESSHSQPIASTSTDVSLQTEHRNSSTSVSIANDGTPKVLESIRMEKRKVSKTKKESGNRPEPETAKIKKKPVVGAVPSLPSISTAVKSTKSAPKSAPEVFEKETKPEKTVAKRKQGSVAKFVEEIVSSAVDAAKPLQAPTVPTLNGTTVAAKQEQTKTVKPKSAVQLIQEKLLNEAVPPKTEKKASVTPKTTTEKQASTCEDSSTPSLPSKRPASKPKEANILKSVSKVDPQPVYVHAAAKPPPISPKKVAKVPAPKSAPETATVQKPAIAKISKKCGGSVESVVASLVEKLSDSNSMKSVSPLAGLKPKTAVADKPPISRRAHDSPKTESRTTSSTRSKELKSVEAIDVEVGEKVSQKSNALSALSKCKSQKEDIPLKCSSNPEMAPEVPMEPLHKQKKSAAMNDREDPRTPRTPGVPNALTPDDQLLHQQRSQKNVIPITSQKKTITESKTKVTNKTVKRQTSIKTPDVEEKQSSEETSCKIKHTTKQKTQEADVSSTVIGSGQIEMSKKNLQKATIETSTGRVKSVSGQQELRHKNAVAVLRVKEEKDGKQEIAGMSVHVNKTAKMQISSDVDKVEVCNVQASIDVKDEVLVTKIKNDDVEVTQMMAHQRKELAKKKPPVPRKIKKEDSGFKSDGESGEFNPRRNKVHKSSDNLLDSDCPPKPLAKKNVTFSRDLLDSEEKRPKQNVNPAGGFALMKTKSESTLHKKRFSVDVAKSTDDICSSASGLPRVSLPATDDDAYSFANLRKQLENRIEQQKSGHMWKSSTELRFTSTNSSNAKRAMNKWLSMEKNLTNQL
uniref:Protein kinase domain-containing protein n=1 Tax=Steinernema glaseri TaxID=37863 RepID=A0A1I8A118_9BILA